MRIVSLVPSLTKTICDFGLQSKIVGCTNFCVDPSNLHRTSKRVGGTKDPNLEMIFELAPTHVIVNDEENRPCDIEALLSRCHVLSTFPKSPLDVPTLLRNMGNFLGCPDISEQRAVALEGALSLLETNSGSFGTRGERFAYLIWRDPWMAVSTDTYISRFMEILGFRNVVETSARYPVVEPADIIALGVDLIFMSSEPWPFRKRDAAAWRDIVGNSASKIRWIDGQAMSWYGTSTFEAIEKILGNKSIVREM
jgi:iron complex transport system substrate-binding protein